MRQVTIQKAKLLAIVTKNRAEHREIFLAAQKTYREKVIEVLDMELSCARTGQPFVLNHIVQLVAPQDHTKAYDRVIKMLELSVDKNVVLDSVEFTNLVQDEWSWSRDWAMSNSRYTSSPKFAGLVSEEEE